MKHNLSDIEIQLKKRLPFYYHWGRIQNNQWDGYTNFIYDTFYWEELILKIEKTILDNRLNKKDLFNYAANRWYNFWSSMAVEQIFTSMKGIEPVQNKKDSEKDFIINGIPLDHKTTIFPKGFKKPFPYAKNHKKELIQWLYKNQSNQQRHHLKNRLFVVVYQENGEHWKLKAEIQFLKIEIEKYVANFEASQLQKFIFTPQTKTLSDIIWVIK